MQAGGQIAKRLEKMDFNDINVLGNLINTTFGKSSSSSGTHSIKCELAGENMTLKYSTVVHFASEVALREQVIRCAEEANQRLDSFLKDLKKEFKAASGNTLKTTKAGRDDNVELIQATSNSARKIALYRMNTTLTLG